MNTKPSLGSASLALGTVGLLVLAVASGCGPAQSTPFDPGPDAAAPVDVDGGASPDTGADLPDGSTLEAGSCAPGTADCDGDPRNGCEAKVSSDAKNCGTCKHDCTGLPHVMGATSCSAGKCVVPTASCATGFAHCSSDPDDGCEADLSKPATCGKCGTTCSGTTPVCASGTCSNGCGAGAPTLCSGSCVDTTKSATNCASCGNACPIPSHGQATCASSQCGFACNSGYHACGNACADNASPLTCGTSCTPCGTPSNGYATCDGTSCGFECNAGFHKCGNACAADADATQCGASCTVCTVPSGAGHATCGGGACGVSCDTGNHLCNGTSCASNSSVATCGTSCTPCAAPAANGHSTCDGTSCGIACDASYHQCGGSCASNNSVQSCGTSCTPCAAPAANGHSTCDGTSCGIACDPGYHQCGGNCVSNTSVNSCGTSCTPCPVPANAQQATCDGTSCGFTCFLGFADCDGQPANGCEVNLNTDGNHCSKCAQDCIGGACSAGACQPVVLANDSSLGPIAARQSIVYYASGASVVALQSNRAPVNSLGMGSTPNTLSTGASVGVVLITSANGDVWSTNASLANPTLLSTSSSQRPVSSVVVGVNAYWGSATTRANEVWASNVFAGPSAVQFIDSPPSGLFNTPNLTALRGDASGFVWSQTNLSGSTLKIANTDLSLVTPFNETGSISDIALDASYIYWISNGALWRATRGGSASTMLINSTTLTHVVADNSGIYITSSSDGNVRFAPPSFTSLQVLATGGTPTSIATAPDFVTWTDTTNNRVMLLAKMK